MHLPRPSAFVRSNICSDPRPLAKRYPRKQCQQIRLGRLADIGDFLKITCAFTQILLQSLFRFRQTRYLDEILKPLESAEFQNFTRARQILKFYPRDAKNF